MDNPSRTVLTSGGPGKMAKRPAVPLVRDEQARRARCVPDRPGWLTCGLTCAAPLARVRCSIGSRLPR